MYIDSREIEYHLKKELIAGSVEDGRLVVSPCENTCLIRMRPSQSALGMGAQSMSGILSPPGAGRCLQPQPGLANSHR